MSFDPDSCSHEKSLYFGSDDGKTVTYVCRKCRKIIKEITQTATEYCVKCSERTTQRHHPIFYKKGWWRCQNCGTMNDCTKTTLEKFIY